MQYNSAINWQPIHGMAALDFLELLPYNYWGNFLLPCSNNAFWHILGHTHLEWENFVRWKKCLSLNCCLAIIAGLFVNNAFYSAWSIEIGKFCKEEKMFVFTAFWLFWASFLIFMTNAFYFAWYLKQENFAKWKNILLAFSVNLLHQRYM